MQWSRVTKDNPCPVCKKSDWCLINDNKSAAICPRVESDNQIGDAGYLHVLKPEENIKYKPSELEQKFLVYQKNVIPEMLNALSKQLNVSTKAIEQLGVGFYPLEQAWVFPEKNHKGKLIGLMKRLPNGKKIMEEGSKRGLNYTTPLQKTVLVVEGVTDTLAAMTMGYSAVGRPGAEATTCLADLLENHNIIVVGENDKAGRKGADKIFSALKLYCSSVRKVLPPIEYKDLREWSPTKQEFQHWLEDNSNLADISRTVETDDPRHLAKRFIEQNYQSGKYRTLHFYCQNWYQYNGLYYEEVDKKVVDTKLSAFVAEHEIVKQRGKSVTCEPFKIYERFIRDVRFNVECLCLIDSKRSLYNPFEISTNTSLDMRRSVLFQNGIYHVDEDRLEPLSPDLFVLNPLPYSYYPGKKHPQWDWFVNEIFNADAERIALLQEWFGYNLIPSNHMEAMMFFFGPKAAGKSTTVDMLEAVLGTERCFPIDAQDFISQFGLSPLVGKYAITISEDRPIGESQKYRVLTKIKQITGQDTIIVRRKYKEPIKIKPYYRITYISNDLLDFADESGAFLRRLNLLHFPNSYADNPDYDLKQNLLIEAPGVAVWAIEGLRRLLKNKQFTKPISCEGFVQQIRELGNPLATMVEECCDFSDPNGIATCDAMFDLHRAWSAENNMLATSRIGFGMKFSNSFPDVEKRRMKINDARQYVYQGISISKAAQRRFLGRP